MLSHTATTAKPEIADLFKHQHKRAFLDSRLLHRDQRRQHEDGADEKDNQPGDGGTNGHRNDFMRILRFPRRDADKLGAGESEVNRHHGHQDRQTAVREPAFGGDIAQPRRRRAILHRNDAKDRRPAENNKGDNGDHLHQREPEFTFGKEAGGDNVERENHRAEHHAPDPYRHLREPVLHAESGGGEA